MLNHKRQKEKKLERYGPKAVNHGEIVSIFLFKYLCVIWYLSLQGAFIIFQENKDKTIKKLTDDPEAWGITWVLRDTRVATTSLTKQPR